MKILSSWLHRNNLKCKAISSCSSDSSKVHSLQDKHIRDFDNEVFRSRVEGDEVMKGLQMSADIVTNLSQFLERLGKQATRSSC